MPDATPTTPETSELSALIASASVKYDAAIGGSPNPSSPPVYGAGLSDLLGGLDPKAFMIEFFAKQVVSKAADALEENREEIADAVAEYAKSGVDWLIDQSLAIANKITK